MKRILIIIATLIFTFTGVAYSDGDMEEGLSAVLLGDYESGTILYEYNIDTPLEIASITKLMTYVVTMEKVRQGKVSLDDDVIIDKRSSSIGESTFRLKEGEKIKLQTLIDSLLIASANDSSVAIAIYIAGSEEEFISLMNEKARDIGLETVSFINTSGLPEKTGENTMSTREIFLFSKYIIENYPEVLAITDEISITIPDRN